MLLRAAAGQSNAAMTRELGPTRVTVLKWRTRDVEGGLAGVLQDQPRSGWPRTVTEEQERAVVKATRHPTPPDATRWSSRTMARHSGLGATSVPRIGRA